MGVKNLLKVLAQIPDIITPCTLEDFRGMTLAVDMSIIVHATFHACGHVLNAEGRIIGPIATIYRKHLALLRHDIIPIYVFDNVSPEEKMATIEARKVDKIPIPGYIYADALKLIKLLGAKYIISPPTRADGSPGVEAEQICGLLHRANKIDYTLTNDSDTLVFGSPMIRTVRNKDWDYECAELHMIHDTLGISRDDFITICVSMGTDFNAPLRNPIKNYFTVMPGPTRDLLLAALAKRVMNNFDCRKAVEIFHADAIYEIQQKTYPEGRLDGWLFTLGIH